jgi:hypothetical protein
MSYRPGDTYYTQIIINNVSGTPTNANPLPIARLVNNGLDDLSASAFVSNLDFGRYIISGVIPPAYSPGNSVGVIYSGLANGIQFKGYVSLGNLDYYTSGASGSIRADIKYLDSQPATYYNGIAQAGGSNSIRLQSDSSSVNDYYKWQYIYLVEGTGVGQINLITSYNGATKDATVNKTWAVIPNNTSKYTIGGFASVGTDYIQGNLIGSNAGSNINLFFDNSGNPVQSTVDNVVIGSGGLDKVMVEDGINMRQWASIVGAAIAGSSTVNGYDVIYYAINHNDTQRITAHAVSGSRQLIVLFPPN